MRAPISIVIPTLNAAAALPATLVALGEGLEAGLIRELILSDGGSTDDIAGLADRAGALLVTGPAGRGGQLARGAAVAEGTWLMFLHADTHLAPGWGRAVLSHICASADRAGYFRLAFRAQGMAPRLVAGWANLRARRLGLPYGDQGLLIQRALYDAVGGFADIPLMEDVAMAKALQGRLQPIAATARTSAARYQTEGWARRGARNLWTLARYRMGADPAVLAARYRRR